MRERYVDLKHELDLAERGGVRIITRGEENYPELLGTIHDAPVCLYVRGEIPDTISYRSLAVVGTRNMTQYGQRMAQHLSEAAAFAGFTVVSGLAYGVDAVAHRAALNAGGLSVSVLGGGLARIQPQEHVPLARDITQHGAVISEFPMEFSPTRHSFPMRNRIISGISKATLVVEAGLNSASLSTEAARIVEFLAKGDASVDDISAATGISASEVMSTLIGLELLRKVRKEGGVYHRLR